MRTSTGRRIACAVAAAVAAAALAGTAGAPPVAAAAAAAGATPTTLALATDPARPILSDNVQGGIALVATIEPAGATGTIQFTLDGHAVGGPVTIADGRATITPSPNQLELGQHTMGATYSGDADHAASSIGPQAFFVSVVRNSFTSVTAPTTVSRWSDATFEATLASVNSPDPGTVQFTLDGAPIGGPAALDAVGRASVTIPVTSALGTHTVGVSSAASRDLSAAEATTTFTVVPAPSTITLPPAWQEPTVLPDTTFPVQVGPDEATGVIQVVTPGAPTQLVPVIDGGAEIPVVFPAGKVTTSVTATYLGDDDHLASAVTGSWTLDAPATAFVGQAYDVALDRAPDPAGLQYWAGRLHAGTVAPSRVTDSLATSGEGRTRVIRDAYTGILDRLPDPSGLAYWREQLARGTSPEVLRSALLASDEGYRKAGGTPRAYAAVLYEHQLDRTGSDADLTFWTKRLGPSPTRWDRQKAALTIGRSSEGTRAAVRAALSDGCGTTEATDAQRAALGAAWITHRHPTRLAGAALVQVCRPV